MSSSSSEGKTSSWEGNTATLLSEDYAEIVDDDADYSTPAGKNFLITPTVTARATATDRLRLKRQQHVVSFLLFNKEHLHAYFISTTIV